MAVAGTESGENCPGWGLARQNVKTGGMWVEARKAGGAKTSAELAFFRIFFGQ